MLNFQKTISYHFRRCVLGALLLTGVAACGMVGVLYQNAASLAMFEIDSYFDLNEVQTQSGRQRTDELMAWHKREALPAYVKQLRALAGKVEAGFDVAAVSATYDWGMGELRRVNQYSAPQQVELLTSLSDKQIIYLQRKLAKDNVKYRKEWVTPSTEDAQALRFEKYLTWAERIYGTFNAEQRQQMRQLSDARSFNPKKSYDERLARQTSFVNMLKTLAKNDAPAAQAQITAFITSLETPSEDSAGSRRELMQLIAATSQIATPAQRAAAKAKLLDYANTFEGLSRGR